MSLVSTQNIQTLLTQLANLESAFINILVQAAVKMTDLYGNKLFILLKSNSGVYYAGDDDLCASYCRGALGPASRGEIRLGQERPWLGSSGAKPAETARGGGYDAGSLTSRQDHSTQRVLHPRDNLDHVASVVEAVVRKRAATDTAPAAGDREGTPPKRLALTLREEEKEDVKIELPSIKDEPDDDDVITLDNDDDDDDVIWDDDDEDDDPIHLPEDYLSSTSAFFQKDPPQSVMMEKISKLKTLTPEEVFVKSSGQRRLLSTVMYGFGRDLATEFAEKSKTDSDLTKCGFFNEKYGDFVKQFPNLTGFDQKIKKGRGKKNIVTASTYVKDIANKAFHKRMKRVEDLQVAVSASQERRSQQNSEYLL